MYGCRVILGSMKVSTWEPLGTHRGGRIVFLLSLVLLSLPPLFAGFGSWAPSTYIITTLGPEACKEDLLWAVGSPMVSGK